MQKQCTNSACRKFFTVSASGEACPWCGKQYTRIRFAEQRKKGKPHKQAEEARPMPVKPPLKYSLLLVGYGSERIPVIKAVRALTGLTLPESYELVYSTAKKPVTLNISHPEELNQALTWLLDAGAARQLTGSQEKH